MIYTDEFIKLNPTVRKILLLEYNSTYGAYSTMDNVLLNTARKNKLGEKIYKNYKKECPLIVKNNIKRHGIYGYYKHL